MGWWYQKPDYDAVDVEIKEGKDYTQAELELIGDTLLRRETKSELCRECEKKGEETGEISRVKQKDKTGKLLRDDEGTALVLEYKEFECEDGHKWYEGEGKMRGIGGENPILFEEHFQSRKRREIYNSIGVPDPEIASGIYNRAHPQGRKINSEEARKKHGASYFRAVDLSLIFYLLYHLTN